MGVGVGAVVDRHEFEGSDEVIYHTIHQKSVMRDPSELFGVCDSEKSFYFQWNLFIFLRV